MADQAVRTRHHFVVLTALRWFPVGLAIPAMVLLLRARGIDLAGVGLLLALYSLVTATLELPTGGLADVIGRRPVLVLSAASTVAASLLIAVGQSLFVLGAAFAILGVARALDSGPLQAWYVDEVQRADPAADLKPGLSQAGVAQAAALGAGALMGGGLVAVSPLPADSGALIALSTPFLVGGLLSIVSLAALVAWVRDPAREQRSTIRDVLRGVPLTVARGTSLSVRHDSLRRLMAFSGALGVVLAGVELLAPSSFAELLGGDSAAAAPYALLVTIGFIGTAGGAALAPAAARLMGSSPRGLMAAAGASVAALLGMAAATFGVAACAFVVFYLLLGIGGPLLDELTHESVASTERATALSVRSMVFQLGGMASSLCVGALAGASSLAVGFGVLAVVQLMGALALIRMPRPEIIERRTLSPRELR